MYTLKSFTLAPKSCPKFLKGLYYVFFYTSAPPALKPSLNYTGWMDAVISNDSGVNEMSLSHDGSPAQDQDEQDLKMNKILSFQALP